MNREKYTQEVVSCSLGEPGSKFLRVFLKYAQHTDRSTVPCCQRGFAVQTVPWMTAHRYQIAVLKT